MSGHSSLNTTSRILWEIFLSSSGGSTNTKDSEFKPVNVAGLYVVRICKPSALMYTVVRDKHWLESMLEWSFEDVMKR